VARPLVEAAVRAVADPADEEARASAAAARRWPLVQRGAAATAARRLHTYLLRRGFPADVVRRAVRATTGLAIADE
jgi:SOS response regulatory protein OraA/RecX